MLTKNIDNLSFWDIALAELPFTDWSKSKIRPILIVKKDRDDYLLMKISSQVQNISDFDIKITSDNENNLQETSIIKLEKLWVHAKEILIWKLWELSKADKKTTKNNLLKFIQSL